jgi:hypothetical protein
VLAPLLLWAALVAPHRPEEVTPLAWLRLPVEGLALLGLLLALRGRTRRWVGLLAGLGLAGLCLYKLVDLGFRLALDRPFDPVTDATYADSTVSLLFDSVGTAGAVLVLVGVVVLVVGLLVGLPLAGLRVAALLEGRRAAAGRALAGALAVWLALAGTGLTLGAGRVASSSDVALAVQQWQQVRAGIRDERSFDQLLVAQRSATAGQPRLAGLRGKDVLLVFVESYGRFALEGPSAAPVTALLDRGTRRLAASGYAARSGFLTSPTFGGMSWLAHATFQSGLWIDSQRRYDRLVEEGHPTLTGAFERAGWRTVVDIPSSDPPWPEGQRLYGFDQMYGRRSMGYRGPGFGYGKVPDQFTLEALHRLELARQPRPPVWAEVDLVSSHTPWVPLPRSVPWAQLGDGSVFAGIHETGQSSRAEVWGDQARLQAAYSTSIGYSLSSLLGFVQRYGDDDLVLIVVGDHQPNSFVTGPGADHDVPVTVIAHDPAVLRRIDGWGWQEGLRPRPDAPVWRMDAFQRRFLAAFDAPVPGGARG